LHAVAAADKGKDLELQTHCRVKLKELIYLFMLAIPRHDDDGDGEGADGVGNGEDPDGVGNGEDPDGVGNGENPEPLEHWLPPLPPHRELHEVLAAALLAQKPEGNWHWPLFSAHAETVPPKPEHTELKAEQGIEPAVQAQTKLSACEVPITAENRTMTRKLKLAISK
jgi:hypothetical protein